MPSSGAELSSGAPATASLPPRRSSCSAERREQAEPAGIRAQDPAQVDDDQLGPVPVGSVQRARLPPRPRSRALPGARTRRVASGVLAERGALPRGRTRFDGRSATVVRGAAPAARVPLAGPNEVETEVARQLAADADARARCCRGRRAAASRRPMPSRPGSTARMPPETPLLAGSPTETSHSPAASYMPQVVITLRTSRTTSSASARCRSSGFTPPLRAWPRSRARSRAVDRDRALAEVEVERRLGRVRRSRRSSAAGGRSRGCGGRSRVSDR